MESLSKLGKISPYCLRGGRAICFAAVCFDLAASRSRGSPSGPWAETMEPALLLPLVKMLTSLFLQVIQRVLCHHQINPCSSLWTIHSLRSTLCQVLTLSPGPLTSLGPMTFTPEPVSPLPSFPILSLFVIVPGYFLLLQSGHLNSPHLILFWLLPFLLLLCLHLSLGSYSWLLIFSAILFLLQPLGLHYPVGMQENHWQVREITTEDWRKRNAIRSRSN